MVGFLYLISAMKKPIVFYLLVVLLTVALPAESQRRRSATLNNASVSAQVLPRQQQPQLQRVSPAVREYISPTQKVEVLQPDGSKDLMRRDEIKVEDGRQTIQYSTALGKLDEKEARMVVGKIDDSLASKIDVSQLKIIPELHFEKSSSDG